MSITGAVGQAASGAVVSSIPGGSAIVSAGSAIKGLFTSGTSAGKESQRLRAAGWVDVPKSDALIAALKRATGMEFDENRKERFWRNSSVPGFTIAKFGNASESEWKASKLAALQPWPNVGHEDWILVMRDVGGDFSPVQAYQDVTSLPTSTQIKARVAGNVDAFTAASSQAGSWDGKTGLSQNTILLIGGAVLGLAVLVYLGKRKK